MHSEVIPAPRDDDDDDVAWALSTAAVQWNRGAYSDAVVWLRRAVDAAITAGLPERTKELNLLANVVADRAVSAAVDRTGAAGESVPPAYEESAGVDELLESVAPSPVRAPPPRASFVTLSDQIPIDVGEAEEEVGDADLEPSAPAQLPVADVRRTGTDLLNALAGAGLRADVPFDDDDDDAPTIPPPSLRGSDDDDGVEGLYQSSDPEALVSPDALLELEERALSEPPTDVDPPDADGAPPDAAAPLAEPATIDEDAPHGNADGEPSGVPLAVDGVALSEVRGLEDLPEEAQQILAGSARVETLARDEEVGFFAAALVTRGRVGIMPAIAEVTGGVASAGDIVFTRGTLDDGIALRVVALEHDTVIASWDGGALDQAMADCPWVADELRHVADRFQALAGATLGPLGDRLDDALRSMVTDRLEVKALTPGEVIVETGSAVPGLHVIGAGRMELLEGGRVVDELGPGDFLFAEEVMSAGAARVTARAGATGALLLVGSRAVAHELLVSVPPLIEILAG